MSNEQKFTSETLRADTATLFALVQEEFYEASPPHVVAMFGLLLSAIIAGSFDAPGQKTVVEGFCEALRDSIKTGQALLRKMREENEDDGA